MRFMIIVKSTPQFEAETQPDPDPAVLKAMGDYHAELARAGVLLDGAGLQPSRKGWRVHYPASGSPSPGAPPSLRPGTADRHIVDGPFDEAHNLIAGYTLIQVRSRDEALEWSRRFPNPVGEGQAAVVEVRQLFELDDFTPGPEIDRMRQINGCVPQVQP